MEGQFWMDKSHFFSETEGRWAEYRGGDKVGIYADRLGGEGKDRTEGMLPVWRLFPSLLGSGE